MFIISCNSDIKTNIIKFGVSGDYPPFEYYENNQLVGFDIDLAKLVSKELGKEAHFADMQFSMILPSINNDSIDAGISTFTVTKERQEKFDFSDSYYLESLAIVYLKDKPMNELAHKKIACQLGSAMEVWLKENAKDSILVVVDNNNQAIESLKAGHVDIVLIDEVQGIAFCNNNSNLISKVIAQSDRGYSIVLKKGSKLKDDINMALKKLENSGKIAELQKKWIKLDGRVN